MTVTLCDALPPEPEQESVNVAAATIGSNSSVPAVFLVPSQSPDATQSVAYLLDHVSVVASPEDTTLGLAERDTVGAVGPLGVVVPTDPPPPPPQPEMATNKNANVGKQAR